MSTQTSRETDEAVDGQPDTNCDTTLTGDGEWETRPAAVYPVGYMSLCGSCFAEHVPDEAWNEDGSAEWDHTQVTDILVASTVRGSERRYHLPEGHEVDHE